MSERVDCQKIRNLFLDNGYSIVKAEMNQAGDCRLTLLDIKDKIGQTFYMTLKATGPTVFEEFCNDTTEVHAFGFGIIHSGTRRMPLDYNQIDQCMEISPDNRDEIRREFHYYLVGFWGFRVLVAAAALWITGLWQVVPPLFGW